MILDPHAFLTQGLVAYLLCSFTIAFCAGIIIKKTFAAIIVPSIAPKVNVCCTAAENKAVEISKSCCYYKTN
jgi:hypothetical protein